MKIGILGAGTMGSGIAQCFAEKGHLVLLCASSAASAQRRKEELAARLEKRILERLRKDMEKAGHCKCAPCQYSGGGEIRLCGC